MTKSILTTPRLAHVFPALALALAVQNAYANNTNISNIWYRDYLDFAQNLGQFKPGATNLQIVRKDGSILKLPDVPMPDFNPVSSKGATASIGGAYTVGANHVRPTHIVHSQQKWGNSTYSMVSQRNQGDFSVQRLNKFVVETEGWDEGVQTKDWNEFQKRYGVDFNGQKKVIAFRVGTGEAFMRKDGSTIKLMASNLDSLLTPSMYTIDLHFGAAWGNGTDFDNIVTGGDSGSPWIVYDTYEKKWVLLGTLYGIGSDNRAIYNAYDQATVDKIKQDYTHTVNLNGKEAVFNKDNKLTLENQSYVYKDKDISLVGGGTIKLTQNLDQGVGGLVFDNNQNYTINGENQFTYKGAGVDISEGTIVEWNIKGNPSDNLHKIGKGTLKVNVAQGNNLKTGNGLVELNAEKSFNNIYMASGKGTVKVNNANALSGGDFGGIFFGERGGTLDLNGHDLTVKKIAANDVGAVITNSRNDHKVNVNLTTTENYIFHGSLAGNTNLNIKHNQKPQGTVVLDGGVDMKGDINVENASLTLQGKADRHAVVENQPCPLPPFMCNNWAKQDQIIQNSEKPDADKYKKPWIVENTPSSFQQPDWTTRRYHFEKLNLVNSTLQVGRNTIVEGNINAQKSIVKFGGDGLVYLDRKDGNNLTGDGFGFTQNVVSGTSQDPTSISYIGDITAKDSQFEANNFLNEASFNLDNSTYRSTYAFNVTRLRDDGIHLKNKSNLNLNAVYVQDAKKEVIIEADGTSSMSMGSLSVNNSTVDIKSHLDVRGRIEAENKATVKLKDWIYKDTNLWSDASSSFTIGNLTAKSGSNIQAGLIINDELKISAMDRANAAFGVRVDRLTLNANSVVKADFSAESLSVNNLSFDKQYKLVSANKLTDDRKDKNVQYSQGNGYRFEDVKGDNSLDFIIHRGEATKGFTSFYRVPDTPMPDVEARAQAVMAAYAKRYGTDDAKKLAENVVAHNQNSGDNKYQEVALYDALNNQDINAGVEALHNIKTRTDDTYQALGRQIDTQKLFAPVRSAVMNRLASLNMGQDQRDEGASRFFMDAGAGFFNGDDDLRYVHTGFGTDAQVATGDNSLIVGGMLGIGRASDKFGASNEIKADMYTMTGYLGWQNTNGWELQNFLTGAYLNGDRTINTEINLGGAQTFDEEGWAVMNATYLKYRIPLSEGQYKVSLKPMLLADLTWSHVGETNTAFFKRDGASEFTGYAGAGLELEASSDKQSYFFQITGRQRLTGDTNTVGVNLNGSNGYTNIDVNAGASFIANMNVMAKFKLTPTSDIDLSVGASADSEGGKGAHGQARVNWYF